MNKQPTCRSCFMCGRENYIGLKMNWYNDYEAQQIWGEVVVPLHFNGYPGVVHGGIVAAILDETAGRALMLKDDEDGLTVTTRLEIKYHQPTPTGQLLRAVGWIRKASHRGAKVAGELRLADGTVTARCEATVIHPPKEFFEKWNWEAEASEWRIED